MESSQLDKMPQYIKEECKKDIKVWNYDTQGILLKIKKVKTSEDNCEIFQESDLIVVKLKCIGVFFVPQTCLIVGKIKFIKNKQIYLKIFGQFKGIIQYSDISEKIFEVDENKKNIIDAQDKQIITKDMLIQFQCIEYTYLRNELVFYGKITNKENNGLYNKLNAENKCVFQQEQRSYHKN